MQNAMLAYVNSTILATATTYSFFTHIEKGAATTEEIAKRAGVSVRGAQALLDGLTGMGLLKVSAGKYANTESASFYLVEGKPAYLGGMTKMVLTPMGLSFHQLPEVVRTGVPTIAETTDMANNPFWEELVLSIVPLAMPLAHMVQAKMAFADRKAPAVLDVGGGSGVYSAVLLGANASATATQIDWAPVNAVARTFVGRFGVGDRFKTVDGDFHQVDYGDAAFDLAIYSNIAHQESPADNVAIFRKLRRALKPNGTLVVSDFVLGDDRTADHQWTTTFHTIMLVQTKAGAVWKASDYRSWLAEAGFKNVSLEPTPMPSTLIYAS
jgi:ubiquinone/menaquinone biosynthesis C-methylase UbiE